MHTPLYYAVLNNNIQLINLLTDNMNEKNYNLFLEKYNNNPNNYSPLMLVYNKLKDNNKPKIKKVINKKIKALNNP